VAETPFRVFMNGQLIAKADAVVSIDSLAFKYVAMVFEGIRGYWNENDRRLLSSVLPTMPGAWRSLYAWC
jgi:hypothetical protein